MGDSQNNATKIESVRGETSKLFSLWLEKHRFPVVLSLVSWTVIFWAIALSTNLFKGDWPEATLFYAFPILFFVLALWERYVNQVRKSFWKQFAAEHNFSYTYSANPDNEKGLMFHQGYYRTLTHLVAGEKEGRRVRIFNYDFTAGLGRSRKTYYYTIFSFRFRGNFPHLYLNRLNNAYSVKVGNRLPLPAEFAKYFQLFSAKRYQIEALQIFTPDLLVDILNRRLKYDIELVDQELIIFAEGRIDTLGKLQEEFDKAIDLISKFIPVLDKISFSKIGDRDDRLRGSRFKSTLLSS